jgi:hypothetical protein
MTAEFFRSYLVAFLFWTGLSVGSLAVLMLHHLVGGDWGRALRPTLERASKTIPLMAVLMIPLAFGMEELYPWVRGGVEEKAAYLNPAFFWIRAGAIFTVWIGLAFALLRSKHVQLLSGPGLVLYGLTVTMAAIDWSMSLEPRWFSSIYGLQFMVGQGLLAFAFGVARQPSDVPRIDVGNLLLMFVLLWTYLTFSQFLIIWSADLPDEVPWYLARSQGGWEWVVLGLVLFHFAVPFFLLLSRRSKQEARVLAGIAGVLIAMRFVDLHWLVIPAFSPGRLRIHWLDGALFLAIGGVWLATFRTVRHERH